MMKRILIAITALAVCGCTGKGKTSPEDPLPEKLDVDITVSFSPFTKVTMDDDGSLKWEAGDSLAIWDGNTLNKIRVESGNLTSDPGTAKFHLAVSSAAPLIAVVFPFDGNDAIEEGTLVTTARRVELGGTVKSQIKAIGFCTPLKPEVSLKNFNTIIRFSLEDDSVRGISLQGNDDEVLMYRSEIRLKDDRMSFHPTSMDYRKLYLTNAKGRGTYYFGLLPGVKFAKGYTMKFHSQPSMTKYNLIGTWSTSDKLELEMGTLLDMGKIAIMPKEKDKYANCYIVSEAGEHSIVPVRGNSDIPVGKVASATLLWETVNTAEKPGVNSVVSSVSYDSDKGLINYTTTSVKGNAVIAATDASGAILWSWHIWNTLEDVGVFDLGESKTMDRNLGALSKEGDLSAGLMYEWGRKDPFLGASGTESSGSLMAATADLNSKGGVSSNAGTGTVVYSIANPTTWIQAATAPWDWIYGTSINDLWAEEKTVYDPCPAGYHVPSTFVWSFVEKAPFPLSGRLKVNGKAFQSDPGSQTSYWLNSVPTESRSSSLNVEADGSCAIAVSNRGLGLPVRCVED